MAYPKTRNTATAPCAVQRGPALPSCVTLCLCQSQAPSPPLPRLCLFRSREHSTGWYFLLVAPFRKSLGGNGAVPLAAGMGSLAPLPTFSTLTGHPPRVASSGQGLCPLGPWEPAWDQMSMFSTPPLPFSTAPLLSGG